MSVDCGGGGWREKLNSKQNGGEKINFDRRNVEETGKSVETTTDEGTQSRSLNSLCLPPFRLIG